MKVKVGELKVNKTEDYYDFAKEALECAGFVVVLDYETTNERLYIIAKESEDKK